MGIRCLVPLTRQIVFDNLQCRFRWTDTGMIEREGLINVF